MAKMQTGSGFWTIRGWKVYLDSRAEFETAWRKRAAARYGRATGWRGELLLRSEIDTTVYHSVERWEDRESWQRCVPEAPLPRGVAYFTQEMVNIEDRLGPGPVTGDHVRFYYISTRKGTTRGFIRAFRRANDAIRAAYPEALGAALVREPDREGRLLEIVRWKSVDAWHRFVTAPPPDPDADAAIHAAMGNIVTWPYVAIAVSP